MTDVYKLDLRQTDAYADANTTRVRLLAALETNDAATMAATLRAVADRLDPPQKAVFRREDGPQVRTRGIDGALRALRIAEAVPVRICPDCIGDAHTYELGRCVLKPPWNGRNLVTPDGCGPEHTFTGSCHLAVQGRTD